MSAGGRSEKHASLFGAQALLYSSRCIPGMTCAGNYYQIWIVEGSLATQTDLHTRGKIPQGNNGYIVRDGSHERHTLIPSNLIPSPIQIPICLRDYANMISLASAGSMLTRSASILSSSSTSSSACTPNSDCIGSVLDYAAAMSHPKVRA